MLLVCEDSIPYVLRLEIIQNINYPEIKFHFLLLLYDFVIIIAVPVDFHGS